MSLGALDTIPCTLAAASQMLWEATTRLAMEAQSLRKLSSGLLPLPGVVPQLEVTEEQVYGTHIVTHS